jgi:hypothetical protein
VPEFKLRKTIILPQSMTAAASERSTSFIPSVST